MGVDSDLQVYLISRNCFLAMIASKRFVKEFAHRNLILLLKS